MVPERAVIGVFLDGHQLDGVVTALCYVRQQTVPELGVGGYLFLFPAHADVGFIDKRSFLR